MVGEKCGQKVVCVEEICFSNLYEAGKFLMVMAERRRPVSITHRRDWSGCRVPPRDT